MSTVANEVQITSQGEAPAFAEGRCSRTDGFSTASPSWLSFWRGTTRPHRAVLRAGPGPTSRGLAAVDQNDNGSAGRPVALGHIWASTQRILIGFALAAIVAVPLGLMMALNPYVNAVVKPVFDLFKPMPPIAWISISILWFGIGETLQGVHHCRSAPLCPAFSTRTTEFVSSNLSSTTWCACSVAIAGMRSSRCAFPPPFQPSSPGCKSPSALPGPACWPPSWCSSRSGLGFIIIPGNDPLKARDGPRRHDSHRSGCLGSRRFWSAGSRRSSARGRREVLGL